MARHSPESSSFANDSASSSISEPNRKPERFDALSDDVVGQIVRWVGIECSEYRWNEMHKLFNHSDLLNFARCSRRFLRLTEPILYQELTQPHPSVDSPVKTPIARNLLKIFRKMSARPDLGRCVKRFHGFARGNDTDGLLPFFAELTDQDRMRLRAAVDEASASHDEANRWLQAVESGQWAAIVALLLSMTPNLEVLTFQDWSHHNGDYTYLLAFLNRAKRLQNSGQQSPFGMSKLSGVSVSYLDTEHSSSWDTENGFSFSQVIPFLELRSVQTFTGHMVTEYLKNPIPNGPVLTLNAKDLSFTLSDISHHALVAILRCFPHLERFYYELSYDVECDPPRMLQALEHLKSCLKELTILADKYSESDLVGFPIGSLADFQKLVSITASASIIIGADWNGEGNAPRNAHRYSGFAATQNLVDVVPPTLELLCLIDCQRHVVRHIFELVSQKSLCTPALRKIDLGWEGVRYPDKESPREPILHPGFSKDEVEKLMADCEEADIKIVIKYLPPKEKSVTFWEEGQLDEGPPKLVRHYFTYPYEGYEECCEQHGCDPKTGRLRRT